MKNPSESSNFSVKTSKSPSRRRPKAKGKNFAQFLGKGIVTYATSLYNQQIIESFLNKKSKHLNYPTDFPTFKYRDFRAWLHYEDFDRHFNTLESFKRVWGYKQQENSDENLINNHFCCVLRRVSRYFLENEFLKRVFQKVHSGYLKMEYAHCYMGKLGAMIRLLKSI